VRVVTPVPCGAMDNLKAADFGQFKISVVMTRESIEQLDAFEAWLATTAPNYD